MQEHLKQVCEVVEWQTGQADLVQSYFEVCDLTYNYELENIDEAWVKIEHSRLVDALIVEESSLTALCTDNCVE